MKKLFSFVLASFLLVGIFAVAKDNNDSKDHPQSPVYTGTHLTWNLTGAHRDDENHTGKQIKLLTGTQFTGLSTGAITCVRLAITTRDAAIKMWMAAYTASWTVAFDARTSGFIAALSLKTQKAIKTAMDTALKTSEKSVKAADKAKKDAINKAWNTYKASIKACNTDVSKGLLQERGGENFDY